MRLLKSLLLVCALVCCGAVSALAQGPTAPLAGRLAATPASPALRLASTPTSEETSAIGVGGSGGGGTSNAGAGGLLGLRYFVANLGSTEKSYEEKYVSGFFNFGSTTMVSGSPADFGASVLNPPTSGLGFSAEFTWPLSKKMNGWGYYARLGATNMTWQVGEPAPGEAAPSVDGWVAYGTLGVEWVRRPIVKDTNSYQYGGIIGASARGFWGDLSQPGLRSEALGTSRRLFVGPELTVFLRLNQVQPFFRLSYFPNSTFVSGLTDWQAYIGCTILGDLFVTKSEIK